MTKKQWFAKGAKSGIPISLGYFAVAIALGISAKKAGISVLQASTTSLLINASAGEYAGFTVIASNGAYFEIALATLVANIRYLLMGCAMSQRLRPGTPLWQRMLMAFHLTDELFGIAIARPGYLNPYYSFGAALTAAPPWAIGTMLGVIAGNMLPQRLVSAFSVALFGMFLAVIIPEGKKNKIVMATIAISFALSLI